MADDKEKQESLKALIYKRGQVKGKVTRFETYFVSLPADSNLTQLKIRLAAVQQCLAEFEAVQLEIENLDSGNEQELERNTFEDKYYDLIARVEDYIESRTPPPQLSVNNTDTVLPTQVTNAQPVRLPSISLPSFTGKYEEWISFSDSFKSLVHQNETLSDIQKLIYLRSSLKDEAIEVINFLELSAANYSLAWSMLQERFQNKRLLVEGHVNALLDAPAAEKESASNLRRLLNSTTTNLRALSVLGQPTEQWDTLMIRLVTAKLSAITFREWENSTNPKELPTMKQLTDFLERRCQVLEKSTVAKNKYQPTMSMASSSSLSKFNKSPKQACFLTQDNTTCRLCKGKHSMVHCEKLINYTHEERVQAIKKAGLCFNCLRPGHTVRQCSAGHCRKCNAKHNTMLHQNPTKEIPSSSNVEKETKPETVKTLHNVSAETNGVSQVLLSTAIVELVGPQGHSLKCRALLDSGSQASFITEGVAQKLHLKSPKQFVTVTGMNHQPIDVHGTTQATVRSCISSYSTTLQFLVVSKITSKVPSEAINADKLQIPKNIALADPTYATPGQIDLLIGNEIFFDLLCIGQIKTKGMPTIQKTRLGWIVGGSFKTTDSFQKESLCHLSTVDQRVDKQLQEFWKLEELPTKPHLTSEEAACETHYAATTRRDNTGRYIVSMPLKAEPCELGESREIAVKRFEQLERRFERNLELREKYKLFMAEYLQLGHMEEVETQSNGVRDVKVPEYFLPHHPVIKEDSSTTKLRVVFDASSKTTTGRSLNDIQLVGPTVQSDLFSILLRFRMFTFVVTADLEKMYRQIEIEPSQRSLLQIVWRDDTSSPIKTYRMKTVTYGTASAPYLATRTLNQLAEEEESNFPEAAEITKRDFYVDDLLTGFHTIEEGLKVQSQLIEMLGRGHFNLRKWNANSERLLKHLPEDLLDRKPHQFSENSDSTRKTLGLWWNAERDNFQFKYAPTGQNHHHLTKRIVLSEIARLFDPLGLVSPVVIRAKVQLQELWKLKLTWDESLPMNICTQWQTFLECLSDLNHVSIKRQITLPTTSTTFEIHGFSDASQIAYGGAVYLKHTDLTGNVKVSLVCAKSRVAPLKTVSIPRLELCAAVLLCEIIAHVVKSLQVTSANITYWTDSTIVLAWLTSEPARWTTFVANRVSKIQELTREGEWRHVSTEDNPADLVSRGARTKALSTSRLWWEGPEWLKCDREQWPSHINPKDLPNNIPEIRTTLKSLPCTKEPEDSDPLYELVEKYSSFRKMIRVLAYCLRYLNNLKTKIENRVLGPLELLEMQNAKVILLRFVQREAFRSEIEELKRESPLKCKSKTSPRIVSLAPFLDSDGLIRVGGRLQRSTLQFDEKHPVLLPKNHKVTEKIALEEHLRNLHCGPQTLLYVIRQQYWPINGRDLTRKITRQCLRCFKAKPKTAQQMMGELPATRVNPGRTFTHTGVDYCGPFLIKQSKRRGAPTTKSYVAVFVCLSTKAVHLELVSDLTSEAFIAALRRFVSRRGLPTQILSDNGTTFVGAKRELAELRKILCDEAQAVIRAAAEEGTTWKFIPAYSPHMGGIWEAAVKSFKHHLKRIVGTASLSFEELYTVLTQVEAVLNSRPLTPMSNDPSDLTVLTPAHFLSGGSLKTLPDPSVLHVPEPRLSRWQRLQQLLQHFWSRWTLEYLNNLQHRRKWATPKPSLEVGTLVLLKEDNLPPLSWPMGRITELHPGKDNLVRVATIKTTSGTVRRNVNKLCPLPTEE